MRHLLAGGPCEDWLKRKSGDGDQRSGRREAVSSSVLEPSQHPSAGGSIAEFANCWSELPRRVGGDHQGERHDRERDIGSCRRTGCESDRAEDESADCRAADDRRDGEGQRWDVRADNDLDVVGDGVQGHSVVRG